MVPATTLHVAKVQEAPAKAPGATAIEYGLIAAAMGVALVAAMPYLSTAITGQFSSLAGHISSGT